MALFKSAKFWVISAVIIAVIGFAKWGHGEIYDSGYNAAELKWQAAQNAAIDAAVTEARESAAIAYAEALANIETEVEIIERVKIVEREVPKIVERVVLAECRDLGPDIQRVFNDAITAANSPEGLPVPGDSAVNDGDVP